MSRQPPGFKLRWPLLPLSDQDRHNVMRQLGVIMSELTQLPMDQIGSLFEDDQGNFYTGECLSPSLLWQSRDSLETIIDRGPFSGEEQYLESLISTYKAHAHELFMNPHAFFAPLPDSLEYPTWDSYRFAAFRWNDYVAVGNKVESSKNRLAYCIAGQFLRNMIPHLSTAHRGYTLSHPDLHLGNIFVDDNLNITCIIDWGSTTSGPITELLATPGLPSSTFPPPKSQVDAFRLGLNQGCEAISPDDWKKSERIWYFSRLVRLLSKQDYAIFKGLYEHVYGTGAVDYPRMFHERAQHEDNRKLYAELCEDDTPEEEVKEYEEAVFASAEEKKCDNLSVARKLTLMSEMNPGFVADRRLWKWIEGALEPRGSM